MLIVRHFPHGLRLCGVLLLVTSAGVAAPGSEPRASGRAAQPAAAPPSTSIAELERSLAEKASLPVILRLAFAKNPELAEARQRVRAAREEAPAPSRLPDPEFEYQLWAQPLARPFALDMAQMHMFGLSQTFPAAGRGARSDAAVAQADVLRHAERARELELVLRVRKAFAEYRRTDGEQRIHREHGRLAQQAVELARAAYQAGRGTQQDVLRANLEASRLHGDVLAIDAEHRTARALLNVLMARPIEAPLGPPAPDSARAAQPAAKASGHAPERPEIAAAESAIRARRHELDGARSSGRWPSFMLGFQYMYMPMTEEPHNYGVTIGVSLPWLNPRYGEEERAAEARVAAEQSALSSAQNAIRYELYAAQERLKAARDAVSILEASVLPQAQQSFESAQAVYRGGQGDSLALFDALKSLLDVRIEHERALARVDVAQAELERAAGTPPAVQAPQASRASPPQQKGRGHHE